MSATSRRFCASALALVFLTGLLGGRASQAQQSAWTNLGVGGGGAFYNPAGSPHDPKLVFVSSDMSGIYRSEDAGKSWQMLDWRQIRHSKSPVFHPTDPNVVYACGWSNNQFKVSHDKGKTWRDVANPAPWAEDSLGLLTIDRANPKLMLLSGAKNLYRSTDGAKTWSVIAGAPVGFIGQHIDQTSPADKRVCFGASASGVWRTSDGGLTWTDQSKGLPSREIRGFSGASDPKTGRVVIYCTIPSRKVDGKFAGGVYRSTDRGETWESAMGEGINTTLGTQEGGEADIDEYFFLSQSETTPDTIFVTNRGTGYLPPYHWTVYRSDDAGKTWRSCFFNDPRNRKYSNTPDPGWLMYEASRGWGDRALGFRVNPATPDQAIYTNYGEVFITMDGGKTWYQAFTKHADGPGEPKKGDRWTSIGIEDTNCWQYAFDPHDKNRTYICYTDIGFARSEDRGKTWYPMMAALPWRNTVYQIAFDPDVPGKIYAASSSQHDIPHWSQVQGPNPKLPGGMALSQDYGKTWTKISEGLPPAAVTSVVVDPTSPKDARVLYCTSYGYGVYKSTNGGKSWVKKTEGIVPENNRLVYRLERTKDGTLYCSVAGRRPGKGVDVAVTGGLHKSTDGAETWTRISSDEIFRPVDFCIHPTELNTIYVAVMDGLGHKGGIYKTTDGGKTWTQSVPDYDKKFCSYIEGFSVALNPRDPNIVYFLTSTHGMFLSRDAGKTWTAIGPEKSPPFMTAQRIYWDPEDPGTVCFVTNGGSVWKGPDPAK